eukprot:scaffold1588_cov222-Amphora_coffeaeformis.AAC.13
MASSMGTLYTPIHSLEVSPGRHAAAQGWGNDEVNSSQEDIITAAVVVAVAPVPTDVILVLRDVRGGCNDRECTNAASSDDSRNVL